MVKNLQNKLRNAIDKAKQTRFIEYCIHKHTSFRKKGGKLIAEHLDHVMDLQQWPF
ncbi:MAG: hypothetical protein IPJ43_13195 [Saprospiraceae bacterium]|nr:hypothetical protein [Saprospiraceae bacterium]